jgi:hypothetical protein
MNRSSRLCLWLLPLLVASFGFFAWCGWKTYRSGGKAPNPNDLSTYPTRNGCRYDPIEDDRVVQPLLQKANQEAEEELKNEPRKLGFCHQFWGTKKHILWEKYGITWRSPADLNPEIAFD